MRQLPYDLVQQACAGNLDDTAHFEKYAAIFCGPLDPNDQESRQRVRNFLKGLPSATDQLKTKARLQEIAKTAKATIDQLYWWDVLPPSERWLFALITRDGRQILLALIWKETVKGSTPAIPTNLNRQCWLPHADAPGGRRYELEYNTYQEMKAALRGWLAKPLDPPQPIP